MGIVHHLSALALGPAVKTACDAAGLNLTDGSTEGVSGFLAARFKDNSQRLTEALHQANRRAWQTLEVALAGDSWWQRAKGLLGPREDQTLAHQVRAFLDATPLPELAGKTKYREACLAELRGARKVGLLGGNGPEVAQPADLFARFVDPRSLLAAEGDLLDRIALALQQAEYRNLADLLTLQARQGQSLLTIAARYFFRRAVEDDSRLFQGLVFTFLDSLQTDQAQAFAALNLTLNEQGERLQTLLLEVQAVVVETHAAVLDVQEEQHRQGELAGDIYKAVGDLQRRLDLMQPQVRPRDSLSIRTDAERQLVKQVVARYRALPEEQRRGLPALLNAVGKLEVAAGDFETAQHDFATVATLTSDTQARGEAHSNAYRTALERRDWEQALTELRQAMAADKARFAPFPPDDYEPEGILGAGGFGVTFKCRQRHSSGLVAVKALTGDDLERDVGTVMREAATLDQLNHPNIIRLRHCGYADAGRTRSYLVMEFFDGQTLEELVREKPIAVEAFVSVARQVVEGLQAAHQQCIFHRDVKPANILLRQVGDRWEVKLIDFGLALKRDLLEGTGGSASQGKTIAGSSINGTLDYAAPEQLGKLPGVPVGAYSDLYGFGRTCYFAFFGTPDPDDEDKDTLPDGWKRLLRRCTARLVARRPQTCAEVLQQLQKLVPPPPSLRLSVTSPVRVAAGGPASIPVRVQCERVNGAVRIELLNCPPGLIVPPLDIPAVTDNSQANWQIRADATAPAGTWELQAVATANGVLPTPVPIRVVIEQGVLPSQLRQYWALKTTSGTTGDDYWNQFLEEGVIAIGWSDIEDDPASVTVSALASCLSRKYGSSDKVASRVAKKIKWFVDMRVGDLVLICCGWTAMASARVRIYGVARVTGPFVHDKDSQWWRFKHKAEIQCIDQAISRDIIARALKKETLREAIHKLDPDRFAVFAQALQEELGVTLDAL